METKICSSCNKEFPRTEEYFNKAKANKDGFNGKCKSCNSEWKRQYQQRNKEKLSIKAKKYREENKEYISEWKKAYYEQNKVDILSERAEYRAENKTAIKERSKRYQQKNKDILHIKNKLYRKNNKEHIANINRLYYQANKNKINSYKESYRKNNKDKISKWFKNNKEKCCEYVAKRKSLKVGLVSTLTLEQWENIKKYFNYECAYCGKKKPLQQEHFRPLSKGGEYTIKNIIPACKSCNCSKNNNDFFKWYPQCESYSKEREQKILKYLKTVKEVEIEIQIHK